jgi:hypothetical protein
MSNDHQFDGNNLLEWNHNYIKLLSKSIKTKVLRLGQNLELTF